MKSEIKESEQSNKSVYPMLMISTYNGTVVLFKSKSVGTVVYSKSDAEPLGHSSADFFMSNFIPFTGEVTLRND